MAQTAPETVEKVVKIIEGEFKKIASEEVGEEELELAKSVCITTFRMSRETGMAQGQEAAIFELYGLGFDYEEKYPERVKEVTAEDVLRVAKNYFQRPSILVMTRPRPEGGQ